MTNINYTLLLLLFISFPTIISQPIIADSIPSIPAQNVDFDTTATFGACSTANTCSDCSRGAKAMLETSNGQYTCLWKLTTISIPVSNMNQDEMKDEIHPLLEEHQHNPNLRSNTQNQQQQQQLQQEFTKTIVTCDLIPFSNELVNQLSIPCSVDPNTLSTLLHDNDVSQSLTQQQLQYPTRKITTFYWIGSILIVLLFFTTLFRVRAVVLGKPFIPEIMTTLSLPKIHYLKSKYTKTMNNNDKNINSYSYTPAPFLSHRNQEKGIRQHSQNASKSLTDKNIQDR